MSVSVTGGDAFFPKQVSRTKHAGLSREVHDDIALEQSVKQSPRWNVRAVSKVQEWEQSLDEYMPPNELQTALDDFYTDHLKPLLDNPRAQKINDWIDSNGQDQWYKQLCTFLLKLPVRVARNVLRLVYNVVKAAIYTLVHPVHAFFKLLQFLIQIIDALSKPATWTKVGAGMIGAAVSQFLLTAGPQSIILLGIGAGMLFVGLVTGAVSAAISAKKDKGEAVKKEVWNHLKSIPESMLTGLIMGMLFGAIRAELQHHPAQPQQMTLSSHHPDHHTLAVNADHSAGTTDHSTATSHTDTSGAMAPQYHHPDLTTAQNYVNNTFIPEHDYTPPTSVTVNPDNGDIIITWKGQQLQDLADHTNLQWDQYQAGNYDWSIYHQPVAPPHWLETGTEYRLVLHDPSHLTPFPAYTPSNIDETLVRVSPSGDHTGIYGDYTGMKGMEIAYPQSDVTLVAPAVPVPIPDLATAQQYVDSTFIPSHDYTLPTSVTVNPENGDIILTWQGDELRAFADHTNQVWERIYFDDSTITQSVDMPSLIDSKFQLILHNPAYLASGAQSNIEHIIFRPHEYTFMEENPDLAYPTLQASNVTPLPPDFANPVASLQVTGG